MPLSFDVDDDLSCGFAIFDQPMRFRHIADAEAAGVELRHEMAGFRQLRGRTHDFAVMFAACDTVRPSFNNSP